MRTLAIETSCDDTSLAIVTYRDDFFYVEQILAYTQTKEHQQRGGVVPEIAARTHAEKILVILDELAVDRSTIDTISVTAYPGLPGALVVGITTAYTLGALYDKPVVEVNHIMGHVFSVLVERAEADLHYPYVCLTVSGGHNDLYLVKNEKLKMKSGTWKVKSGKNCAVDDKGQMTNDQGQITPPKHNHLGIGQSVQVGSYTVTKLGQTLDDAAGECFDKVARMLGGPYPGGAWIGQIAEQGHPDLWRDKHPEEDTFLTFLQDNIHVAKLPQQPYNVSFSGVKGQIHQLIERTLIDPTNQLHQTMLARYFQEQVTDVLIEKLLKAVVANDAKTIGIVGGVSANRRLREKIQAHPILSQMYCLFPTKFLYCTDNAGMIGTVGLLESSLF